MKGLALRQADISEAVQELAGDRKRGDTLWRYNLLYDVLGDPVITHRALPWATWRENIQGYFIWPINYCGLPANPWRTRGQLGGAMYVYPGLDGPVDSLRWEQTPEGLEERDYLVMLEGALQRPDVPPPSIAQRGRAALARARAVFADPRSLIGIRPSDLPEIRMDVGELLDRMAQGRQ